MRDEEIWAKRDEGIWENEGCLDKRLMDAGICENEGCRDSGE